MKPVRQDLVYHFANRREYIRDIYHSRIINRVDNYLRDTACDISFTHGFMAGLYREAIK